MGLRYVVLPDSVLFAIFGLQRIRGRTSSGIISIENDPARI